MFAGSESVHAESDGLPGSIKGDVKREHFTSSSVRISFGGLLLAPDNTKHVFSESISNEAPPQTDESCCCGRKTPSTDRNTNMVKHVRDMDRIERLSVARTG